MKSFKFYNRLKVYYKPYKKIFIFDLLFALLESTVSLSIPLIIRHIISKVIFEEPKIAFKTILWLDLIMLLLISIMFVSNYFMLYFGHIIGVKIENNMRNDIFAHYQSLSFDFFDNQNVGQLMSRMTIDLNNISEALHHIPEDILLSFIKFIGSFIVLFYLSWKLAIAAFIFIPILFIYLYFYSCNLKYSFFSL